MYQVMVVDDEPTAVNLIVNIIGKKYGDFRVLGTAYDGEEALALMAEKGEPDVLITDISMPVMDGLKLVEKTKERYPEVMSVIVSGYQEFEYAKKAIAFGVCDYILKPIVPSEFAKLMGTLEDQLKQKYYRERNRLMHQMVNELAVDERKLHRYFQSKAWYGAITRRNGLPGRFSDRNQREIFSDINELIFAYGRDSQEMLYLCPGELIDGGSYEETIRRHIGKEQPEAAYVTTVIRKRPVPAEKIGELVRGLYRTLDSSIVVGKSRTLVIEDDGAEAEGRVSDGGYEYMEELEYLAKKQHFDRFRKKTVELLHQWEREERPQIWLEARLRQIFYLLQRYDAEGGDYREREFLMDEAFANAENAEQLEAGLTDIFFKDHREEALAMQKLGTEEYFDSVKEYIRTHMAEPLSLNSVSREVGVSQTYLSRLFRRFENESFGGWLTALRMEKAKKLLSRAGGEKPFVKDVAEQVGYRDQFYFSRIFYSYTGVRPSEYTGELWNE